MQDKAISHLKLPSRLSQYCQLIALLGLLELGASPILGNPSAAKKNHL